MAALYDGIEPMLANMHWSTKSTYQIQSTFYVIYQTATVDLPAKPPRWARWYSSVSRNGSRWQESLLGNEAERPSVVETRGIDGGSSLQYSFEREVPREVTHALIIQN